MKILLFGHLTKFIVFFLYRKCLELGKLVSNSGVLDKAWSKISAAHGNQVSGLEFKPYHEGIYTIVVFVAPSFPFDSAASTPLSGPEGQNPFHFLRSENIFSFSLHKPAYQLFVSANKNNLTELKLEVTFNSHSTLFCLQATTLGVTVVYSLLFNLVWCFPSQ